MGNVNGYHLGGSSFAANVMLTATHPSRDWGIRVPVEGYPHEQFIYSFVSVAYMLESMCKQWFQERNLSF